MREPNQQADLETAREGAEKPSAPILLFARRPARNPSPERAHLAEKPAAGRLPANREPDDDDDDPGPAAA